MRFPGLIDPHVHLREPGASYKEDWSSGTAAALAGGFTQVLAMPNTQPPVVDGTTLSQVYDLAERKARCDFMQYLGAGKDNADSILACADQSAGLKLYLDQTYGPLQLGSMSEWMAHFKSWPKNLPMVAHAEGKTLAAAILIAALVDRPLHLAHLATREEVLIVRKAKERGLKVTCEVTPHHLFLTDADLSGGWGEVRPRLGSQADVDALWDNLDVIDCFATDHAPHTRTEKGSDNPPPGFPGLETALSLFLTAVHQGRLSMKDVIERMSSNVRRIFNIPEQTGTWVDVDLDMQSTLTAEGMYSKAGWTPFEGYRVHGGVHKVVLRGDVVMEDGEVLAPPGFGQRINRKNGSSEGNQ